MSSSYHFRGGGEICENFEKRMYSFLHYLSLTQGQQPVVTRVIIEKVLTIVLEASY